MIGIHPAHLRRVFRAATGLSPYAYLIQLRVMRAGDLLRRGVPIAAAAVATGFVDQSHLTRTFKRYMGLPPGGFARRFA